MILLLWCGVLHAQNVELPRTPALATDNSPIAVLQHDLMGIFNDPRFSNAEWGVAIQSVETGEYLFRMNDGKSLLPASNFKLLTAAEALTLLGTDFRYTTDLLTTAKTSSDGTLRGDIVIRGAGDPTLGSTYFSKDSNGYTVFDAWADSLKHKGIRRIEGSIIGDDSYLTPEYYPQGWSIEDIPYYYAMPVSALVFNEDQVSVSVTPGVSNGSTVKYEVNPSTDYVSVDNYGSTKADSISIKRRHLPDSVIATGSNSIDISRDNDGNEITIRGKIPLHGTAVTQQLSVDEPALFAATVLTETLEEHGIEVSGEAKSGRDVTKPYPYLKARILASYTSPPLSDIVRAMDKESDNLIAEELFRTCAKEIGGAGSWDAGIHVMKRFLNSVGIDSANVSVADGSGLSRMDLVSADDFASLLHFMHERPKLYEAFYESLPVMGIDGTLSSRLKGSRAEGNVHAKTGFLTGDRSISGYLKTLDGELIAFSFIGNNFTVPVREANNVQDLAILRLVNFSRK